MLENLGTSTDFYKASLPGTDAPTGQTLRGHKSLRPVGMLSPEMLHQFGSHFLVQNDGIGGFLLPSGYVKIAMEHHHFSWENPLLMVIFNSYVKLPEGK